MSEKAIAILAVRLMGLYWFVYSFGALSGSLSLRSLNINDPTEK